MLVGSRHNLCSPLPQALVRVIWERSSGRIGPHCQLENLYWVMAAQLRPATLASEPTLFEAMLEGWRRQQEARRLTGPLIEGRIRLVRRFAGFTGAWPWQSTPAQVEDWITSGGWAHSRVRSHEGTLAVFLGYACDPLVWLGS